LVCITSILQLFAMFNKPFTGMNIIRSLRAYFEGKKFVQYSQSLGYILGHILGYIFC
jgi:hypothetical protein